MSVLIICLIIAAALTVLSKGPVGLAQSKLGGYNNKYPREQQSKLTGYGARALAAHQNSYESIALFAPAVLVALATNHLGDTIQYLAITHVAARLAYHTLYLVNIHYMRTFSWLIATGSSFAIMFLCL